MPIAGTRIRKKGTNPMTVVLPPALTVTDHGQPLARAITATVLAVPLVIATAALAPALALSPFLPTAYRQQVPVLLASLQHWTASLAGRGRRCSCSQDPMSATQSNWSRAIEVHKFSRGANHGRTW